MRAALTVLADELRRLKTTGIKSVSVSESSLGALRAVIRRSSASVALANAPAFASAAVSRTASIPVTKARASLLPPPPALTLPPGDKAARWAALVEAMNRDPVNAAQVAPDRKLVLGSGNLDAKVMFVIDAPAPEETKAGELFVGPAGQLLGKMVVAMGMARADVYLGCLMSWRPGKTDAAGEGRSPTEEELRYSLPFLRAQVEIVQPTLLVALGSSVAEILLGPSAFKNLAEVRGTWREYAGVPMMVTYHPSYLIRPPVTDRKKRMVWEDLLKVMERAALPISEKQRGFFLEK